VGQKSGPELVVLSLMKAQWYEPTGVEICISITNPDQPPPRLSPKFAAVLPLCFTDIARASPWDFDVLFDETHAAAITDFVAQWPHAERIVIHCMAGMGRSPGVALGLCDIHGWPTETIESERPLFNTWVRTQLARHRHT
jgi:predicted protein tyrosine phosphatase